MPNPAFFLSVFLVLLLAPLCTAEPSERPPNIIFIMADDLGREAVGAYGGESYATPRLDRLAETGLKFEHFYATPKCHPTRLAVVSGRYAGSLGNPLWGSFPGGEVERQTVAHHLKQAGYATVAAGKWHLQKLVDDPQHPYRLGFDEYAFYGWREGPRYWSPLIWQNGERREGLEDAYGPDVFVDFLHDFMSRHREQPFFAYHAMVLPHPVSNDLDPHPPHGPKGRYMTYAEMVAETDRIVGRVVDAVDELGIAENTLIFFTADNGTPPSNYIRHEGRRLIHEPPIVSMWKGRPVPGGKRQFNDWGIRMPTMAVWPGTIKPGTTTDAMADISDLFPTFGRLAGLGPPDFPLDGVSFAGLLTGGAHVSREWIFSQTDDAACIRTREWKLHSDGRLFHMIRDPFEEEPVLPEKDDAASAAARAYLEAQLAPLIRNLRGTTATPEAPAEVR